MSSSRSKIAQFLTGLHLPSLAAFFVLLTALDVVFRACYLDMDAAAAMTGSPFCFTLLWAALLTGIVCLLPDLARRIAMPLIALFWGLICLTHTAVRHLTGSFFSAADLFYADDGAKFFSSEYVVLPPALVAFCIAALCAVILMVIFLPKKPWKAGRAILAALLILAGVLGINQQNKLVMPEENTRMSWDVGTVDRDTDSYLYRDMSDPNRCMELAGSYQYLWRSILVSSGLEDAGRYGKMYEALDAWYAEKQKNPHRSNSYSGLLEGKNCFFILLESIDTWMLTEEYMPNLYALQQQSVDLTNHYSCLYITASTFNTEFIANTGQIPPSAGLPTDNYLENSFPMSLAKLFEAKGYTSRSFHAADPGVYNRAAIHKNLGFEEYYFYNSLNMEDYMLDSQLTRGFSLMTLKQPFFDFILTYSGHGPYTEAMANISGPHLEDAQAAVEAADVPADIKRNEEYVLAIAHAMETDTFVGSLMEKLEESGLAEDTALVFFTDHYCKYMSDTNVVMRLKGVSDMDNICHTPCFIWSAGLSPRKVTKVTSTMDIAPTMANLFSLDVDYAWYPGCDVFSSGGGKAVFRGGSWIDGQTYSAQPTAETLQLLELAGDVLRCDYFRSHAAQ
ncbi:MAG: LTA synthase family protein [Firmicutes bacterium]|nr:LTA synthase family protein [Bacillota bacterium]